LGVNKVVAVREDSHMNEATSMLESVIWQRLPSVAD